MQNQVQDGNGTAWNETGFFVPPDLDGNDKFGTSMVVQANYLTIGSELHDGDIGQEAGAVYAFFFNDTEKNWEQIQKLVPAGTEIDDNVGSAVGMYCDSLFVGAQGESSDTGMVYWYNRNATLAEELTCNDDPVPIRECNFLDNLFFGCDPYSCRWWEPLCWLSVMFFGSPEQPEPCPEVFDPCV